jgi:hypothetical protein
MYEEIQERIFNFRYDNPKDLMNKVLKQLKKYHHKVVVCDCGMRVAQYYLQYHLTHRKHALGMQSKKLSEERFGREDYLKQERYERQCKQKLLSVLETWTKTNFNYSIA